MTRPTSRAGQWHWRKGAWAQRARFFRRIAVIVLLVLGFALWGIYALASLITLRLGIAGWAGPVSVLVILLFAVFAAVRAFDAMRRFNNPLGEIMDAAEQVAEGNYTVRVRESGPPPVRALAQSFNAMTTKLHGADRQRRDLMADLAHELRTPLSVLQGRIEGLIDGVYAPGPDEFEQLLAQTKVLSRLIEDLRTLALSDAGVLELQKESTDVVQLVQRVVENFQTQARKESVEVRMHAPSTPITLNLDAVRIREVLINLLSNALQHASGRSVVDVMLEKAPDHVAITVKDNGPGMPQESVARLFERFHKRAGSEGSGLGLAIARQLVLAHGGRIDATSAVGAGTAMCVTLPVDAADSQ